MAKKEVAAHEVRINKADLAKLPKNEQRRYVDLGYIVDGDEPKGKV